MVFGNLTPVVFGRKTLNTLIEEFYSHFKSHRYYGVYQFLSPTLIISDLELIKELYVKNFDSFMNRPDLIPKIADPFWKKALMNRDGMIIVIRQIPKTYFMYRHRLHIYIYICCLWYR